jgi:colanic acid biosynthesis protein WcaH
MANYNFKLEKNDYLDVIKKNHIISIDLLLYNSENQLLLGYRTNNPAKNTWFVPGGRVYKSELFPKSISRIAKQEVGINLDYTGKCLGAYHHNYPCNFDNNDYGTNYICFPHEYHLKEKIDLKLDMQHSEYVWFDKEKLLNTPNVHQFVKNYFIKDPTNKIL